MTRHRASEYGCGFDDYRATVPMESIQSSSVLSTSICKVILLMCITAMCIGAQVTSGGISGSIHDQNGKPLQNIWVTALRTSLPPARATAQSDAQGNFILQSLTEGTYQMCGQSVSGEYLDPCWWSSPSPTTNDLPEGPADVTAAAPVIGMTVRVNSGKLTSGVDFRMQPSAAIQIRINDPQGLLTDHPERGVNIGVMTKAAGFFPALVKSIDAGGRTLRVSVPPTESLRLMVSGVRVGLLDGGNSSIPNEGTSIWVSPSAGTLSFTVNGLVADQK